MQDATKRPDIATEGIQGRRTNLGAQVAWRADHRFIDEVIGVENLRNAEVTDPQVLLLGQKEICAFKVPVEYLSAVQILETKTGLREPTENQRLWKRMLLISRTTDAMLHVATLCIVHDDGKSTILKKALQIRDDVRMLEGSEDSHFVRRIVLMLAVQAVNVDGFHYAELPSAVLHHGSEAEAATPNTTYLRVAMALPKRGLWDYACWSSDHGECAT